MKAEYRTMGAALLMAVTIVGSLPSGSYAGEISGQNLTSPQATYTAPAGVEAEVAAGIANLQSRTQEFNAGLPLGEPVRVDSNFYIQDFNNNISALYSVQQKFALWINKNAFEKYLLNPEKYGLYLYSNRYENNAKTGELYVIAQFSHSPDNTTCDYSLETDKNGYGLFSSPDGRAVLSHYYRLEPRGDGCAYYFGQAAGLEGGFPQLVPQADTVQPGPVDTSFDWSKARFIELQQVLEYTDQATGNTWYLKALPNDSPMPGARPVLSNDLLIASNLMNQPGLSNYDKWVDGGSYRMYSSYTMLGAPLAAPVPFTTDDGRAFKAQQFEGGTLYSPLEVTIDNYWEIYLSLNEQGQAKSIWFDSLGL